MIRTSLIAAAAGFWAPTAEACRLALVLAIDVSSSVDASEDALQRAGLAAALTAPDVQAAFFATPDPVALAVFEWSGRYNQLIVQDWVFVDTPATLADVANRIATTARSHSDYPTAMGHAVGFAATLLQRGPACDAQTIDVSGDGPNNDGFAPRDAYGAFPLDGVIVNGLVIDQPDPNSPAPVDLLDYYAQNVIRGPGAFIEIAQGFDDFARAMEAKLIRELGVRILGRVDDRRGPRG